MTISITNSLFHKIDLSLLKYFFDVATYGGFTKASRATGASQPALSLGVQKLEKTLDVKLLERKGREFALTHEGRELLQFCKRFESGLQTVVENFGSEAGHRQVLKIGTALSVGFDPLVGLCLRAAKSERVLEVELTAQNTFELMKGVAESQIDAALVPEDVYDSRLRFTPIFKDHIIFVLGSKNGSLLSSAGWMTQVEKMNLITYPRETPMRSMVDKIIQGKGLHFRRTFSVNSIEALKTMVERNVGGAFVLRSLVLNELRSGALIEPKKNVIRVKSGISLAVRGDERGTDISNLILDLLKNQ